MEIKDVENLAELAKLELSEAEKAQILKDMEGILAYVDIIKNVEVSEIQPEFMHKNSWREDTVREEMNFSYDLIMNQFPENQNNFLRVKKIL